MVILALVGLKIGEKDAHASEVDLDWFTTRHECRENMSREECNAARANARAQAKRDAEAGKQVTRDDRDCRNKVTGSQVGIYGVYPQVSIKTERVCEGHDPMIDGAFGKVPMSEAKENPWLATGEVPATSAPATQQILLASAGANPWTLSAVMDDAEMLARRNRELELAVRARDDHNGDLSYRATDLERELEKAKAERDEAQNRLDAVMAEKGL